MKVDNIKKIVMWCFVLFMPLSTYTTVIKGVTLGDIGLFISFVIAIIFLLKKKIKTKKFITVPLIFYLIMVIINTLVIWIKGQVLIKDSIMSVCRYLFYLIYLMFIPKYFLEKEYTYKIYKGLSVCFALYTIIQYVSFYCFKRMLPINVLGLPTVDYINNMSSTYIYNLYDSELVRYRPYSIFLEPAYYAAFQIPILYMVIISGTEKIKNKYCICTIIIISFLLSATTTGVLMGIICLIKGFKFDLSIKKIKIMIIIILISSGPIMLLLNTNVIKRVNNRIITKEGEMGDSVVGRMSNYQKIFEINENRDPFSFLFGEGMWASEGYYLPSIGKVVISFGIIGLASIIFGGVYIYVYSNKIGKMMIFFLLIMCIGTDTLFNISSVLFFGEICNNYKNEGKKNEYL